MKNLYPYLFEPNLHTVVWGGNRLRPFKGLSPTDEPIGESWEVSAVPGSVGIISNGLLAGRDLVSVINEAPEDILGKSVSENMIGHKLGEFSLTRRFTGHAGQERSVPTAPKAGK